MEFSYYCWVGKEVQVAVGGFYYSLANVGVQVYPSEFAGMKRVGTQLFLWYLAEVIQLFSKCFPFC